MPNDVNANGADTAITAKSRTQVGPVPDWVKLSEFDAEFKSEHEVPITYLLFDTQTHAERSEAFTHQAIRLETMEAVQRWSQWRLQFEPKTQSITLHSLKIRRGELEIDQTDLEKAHFLQREEGLDKFIIHGWFTLLIVLEDVRPGDIVEFAYTIETQARLFPDMSGYFFTLPQAVSIGKYHFSSRFNAARQRKWRSSSADLKPLEVQENGLMVLEWSGEKYIGLKPEVNTPSWHISYLWIQVSDFSDWAIIAAGLAKAWVADNTNETVGKIAKEIETQEPDLPSRIEKAIRLVQDECRYLSINLELGGQIPTSPETVARRRFGDCKDLSFLLVNLLKKLGAEARPILVNSFLRKSVGDFLPMPSLFNHAIVEFEAEGKRRWIDATFKEQGGGAFNRIIPNYARGLPVAANATGLIQAPEIPEQCNRFDLHENVLLDTAGATSLMAVTLTTEGQQADLLRLQLKKAGVEETAKQRLQVMINRFTNAKRTSLLKYRDERSKNRLVLVEVFEIKFGLSGHSNDKLCRITLPGNWLASVLARPEKKTRQTPFALPYPCHINYVGEVNTPALRGMKTKKDQADLISPFIQFERKSKAGNEFYSMSLSLITKSEFVPPDIIEKHGELVEQIGQASCRTLTVYKNYSRSRPGSDFGELPPVSDEKPSPPSTTAKLETVPVNSIGKQPKHQDNLWQDKVLWLVAGAIIIFVIILFAICL